MRKTTKEERAGLDLSRWDRAFNGAEPVRADTLAAFARAFADSGFRSQALYPCYGLAEANFVSGGLLPEALPVTRRIEVDTTPIPATVWRAETREQES